MESYVERVSLPHSLSLSLLLFHPSLNLLLSLLDLVGDVRVKLVVHLHQVPHVNRINLKTLFFQIGSSCQSRSYVGLDGLIYE